MKSNLLKYKMINPRPEHFEQIQELCRRVYPFSKPWSLAQLESHRTIFPDGQLIVVDTENKKVVGLAFSLIISWNDYSPQDNWQDFTSAGFFYNHDPKRGTTLYGAEVMVDPDCRSKGIGKMLYEGRLKIVEKYNLKRIRAGARLRGYSKFKDKLTPQEYAKEVVEGKIYDPTLSFQVARGFQVFDVAPNYLFNDPESLGFAAVIEWLNPKRNTERDYTRQRIRISSFMKGENFVPEHLPKELRRLVRITTTSLGQAIKHIEGEKLYRRVEHFRDQLKKVRGKKQVTAIYKNLLNELSKEKSDVLMKLAHAFSLQLELVNACETAYRTWRLRQKSAPQTLKTKIDLTHVLTAHPTEARAKNTVEILSKIQNILIEALQNNFSLNQISLNTQVQLLWLQSLSKTKQPRVVDEADYIFSLVLSPEILPFILHGQPGYSLKLRTWVGGDKDGHPGVDKQVMKQCLSRSRFYLVNFIDSYFNELLADISELPDSNHYRNISTALRQLQAEITKLSELSYSDGTRIKKWTLKLNAFQRKAPHFVRSHEKMLLITQAIQVFPALVLPIELREDASLIEKALTDNNSAIRNMLTELNKVAGALDVTHYARGLVISHCEGDKDISNACTLVQKTCVKKSLPVIPLFESREALVAGKKILKTWLKSSKNQELVRRHWGNKLEIMLGYSDSAKQTGVLASRLLIAKAMNEIDRQLKPHKIKSVFFHGSGGSVARGGGSLKEQISWWSQSAIENPKMTTQGEMIQRTFSTKEILNSHCSQLTAEALRRKVQKVRLHVSPELDLLANESMRHYSELVNDSEIITELLEATPFRYLEALKIGSRPTKRPSQKVSLDSLRAIPWVLCWTQSRILLPTWWGVGSAWKNLSQDQKQNLKKHFAESPFFSSYVKILGFTLAKVEMDIWEIYLQQNKADRHIHRFKQEYDWTLEFFKSVSGQSKLIWHRPWLEESIQLRSPHIHILNLIQILAMRKKHEPLLRETLVGIACGMLTTG